MTDFAAVAELARKGDSGAIETLLCSAREHLRQTGKLFIRPPYNQRCSKSDIIQETLMAVSTGLPAFRGTTENEWFAWVDRIARNKRNSATRDQDAGKRAVQRDVPVSGPIAADTSTPSAKVSRKEQIELFVRAIGELPEPQRSAFRLRYLDGLKLAAIAERLGKTQSATAGLIKRAAVTIRGKVDFPL